MKRKVVLALVLALLLFPTATAFAQDVTPQDLVREFLTGLGYKVIDVGLWVDANGNPDPNTAAAEVELATNAAASDRAQAAVYSFLALRQAYPNATVLLSLSKVGTLIYILPTAAEAFDKFVNKEITGEQYAQYLKSNEKVWDLVKGAYVNPICSRRIIIAMLW